MKRAGFVLAAMAVAAIAAVACNPAEEDTDDAAGAANAAADSFWGDDRVGARFAKFTPDAECKAIPKNYAEVEACFGIGRKCQRKDSAEVYVVEEKQARTLDHAAGGSQRIFPRVVVTGCNMGDKSDPATLENSFSLMAALFSPPDETDNGDTLEFVNVEVMALDKTTGLFNYYVFGENDVTRVFRENGKVFERKFLPKTSTAQPAKVAEEERCFGCHVNGAPLMNELSDPWTNWVSFKQASTSSNVSGATAELVTLAKPDAVKGRSSLAENLEKTIKAAHCRYVGGNECKTGATTPSDGDAPAAAAEIKNGYGTRVLEGKEAGGIPLLLKSVFCQTELNYTSAREDIPQEVFFDPTAVAAARLPKVPTNGDTRFPFLLPVRSEFDKDVELFLIGKRVLAPSTVTAIRLADDENDIFSAERCALHADLVKKSVPTERSKVDPAVRDLMSSKLSGPNAFSFAATQPARVAYLNALLTRAGRDKVDAARMDYLNEVRGRNEQKVKAWSAGGAGKAGIVQRQELRQKAADEMFQGGGPLPVLPLPPR